MNSAATLQEDQERRTAIIRAASYRSTLLSQLVESHLTAQHLVTITGRIDDEMEAKSARVVGIISEAICVLKEMEK